MDATSQPVKRRVRTRTVVAASAVGLALTAGIATAWVFRVPIALGLVRQNLAAMGVDSAFQITRLDLGGADLVAVRLGPEDAPDAVAASADIRFAWGPLPRVGAIRLVEPRLRARIDANGVSLGSLDGFFKPSGGPRRAPRLPEIGLEIIDGQALVTSPFGALTLTMQSQGRIGRDFSGAVRLAPVTRDNGAYGLSNAQGELIVRADADGVVSALEFSADGVRYGATNADTLHLAAALTAPRNLESAALETALSAERLATPQAVGEGARFDARVTGAEGLARWTGPASIVIAQAADGPNPRWIGREVTLESDLIADFDANTYSLPSGRLRIAHATLTARGREGLRRAWPSLGALPIGPLVDSARDAALTAFEDVSLDAPFVLSLDEDGAAMSLTRAISAQSVSGGALAVRALDQGAPILLANFTDGALAGAGLVEMSGGGLPSASIRVDRLTRPAGGALDAVGAFSAADWRANGAALSARRLDLRLIQNTEGGEITFTGPATMSGPIGPAQVRDLVAPLDLRLGWGDALRIAPATEQCMQASFAQLTLPGLVFLNGQAPICAETTGFFSTDAEHRVAGGVVMAPISFAGHIEGDASQSATLTSPRIAAIFSGSSDRLVIDAVLEQPTLHVALAPDHAIRVTGARVTARMQSGGGSWSAEGRFDDGVVDDATLPSYVTDISAIWNAVPRGEEAVIRFANGVARLTDRAPADPPEDRRTAFNPISVTGVSGVMQGGVITAEGDLLLEDGARRLGEFDARHQIEGGAGTAQVRVAALTFDQSLQPYEITELARGVVENVRGPLSAAIDVRWAPDEFAASGQVGVENLSLASATLPIIENVTGTIVFDDLLLFKTPPHQRFRIGTLNPGIAVTDGVIDFQLLGENRIAIESARWPFAGGALAVDPTTLTIGAEETRLTLTLAEVDVASLLTQLQAPDLVATGTVGGRFPLVLTPQAARIENGTLATTGGGTIAYNGAAGDETTGSARIAFDALRAFNYDALSLELNGDLGGELITSINFSGRNSSGVDLASGTQSPIPISVAGVPFQFTVTVTAPFRQLSDMASGVFDPGRALEQVGDQVEQEGQEQPAPIDQPAATPE